MAEAYLADITPRWSRGKAISVYSSSMLIAEVLGPSIGVAVYKLYVSFFGEADVILALKSPIVFLAVSCLISTITLMFLPPRSEKDVDVRERRNFGERFNEVLTILKRLPTGIARSIKVIYVNGLINGLAIGILQTAAIVYIIEIAKDPLFIGLFFSAFSFVALPATLLGGYLSDKARRRKPFVAAGYFIGRASFFLMPLARDYISLTVVGLLVSLIFGFSSPIMRALQADLAPENVRGSVFGLQQLFFNTGVFAGSIAGGYLTRICAAISFDVMGYALTGYTIPFWLAGALGIVTAVLFTAYVEERSPHE